VAVTVAHDSRTAVASTAAVSRYPMLILPLPDARVAGVR
jgi:hypothetical protein